MIFPVLTHEENLYPYCRAFGNTALLLDVYFSYLQVKRYVISYWCKWKSNSEPIENKIVD